MNNLDLFNSEDVEALTLRLQGEYKNSQNSERWAMYRLVVPILDFAFQASKETVYFEQPIGSDHVDIAITATTGTLVSMIEVKAVGQKLTTNMVQKYLVPGLFHKAVFLTNGVLWLKICSQSFKCLARFELYSGTGDLSVSEVLNLLNSIAELRTTALPKPAGKHPKLTEVLNLAVKTRQHSEKWVMYRILLPIVDTLKTNPRFEQLTAMFEFPLNSDRVDMALRLNDQSVLIETKHLDKTLYGNEVDKYLFGSRSGIVTDGNRWIFIRSVDGQRYYAKLQLFPEGHINETALKQLMSGLQSLLSNEVPALDWVNKLSIQKGSGLRPPTPRVISFSKKLNPKIYSGRSTKTAITTALEQILKPQSRALLEELHNACSQSNSSIQYKVSSARFTGDHPALRDPKDERFLRVKFSDNSVLVSQILLQKLGKSMPSEDFKVHNQTSSFMVFKTKDSEKYRVLGRALAGVISEFNA